MGVNVRPSRGCCLVCGFVGGWLLGCRESAKSVFQKSELASCSRSDSGLLKNNADFRQPRISSPPAEADQTASPARAVRFKAVGLGWLGGSWMSRQRCAGRLGGKAEIPCGLKRGMGHRRCAGWLGETGNLRLRIPRFDQSSVSFPRSLLYLQYLPFSEINGW